jgi:hypothetical protein
MSLDSINGWRLTPAFLAAVCRNQPFLQIAFPAARLPGVVLIHFI